MTQHNLVPFREVILAAIDMTAESDVALARAWSRAAGRADAELHVVCVAPEPAPTLPDAERIEARYRALDEHERALHAHVLKQMTQAGLAPLRHAVTVHVRYGKPHEEILQVATDVDADLLVIGSHEKSGLRHHIDSVSRALLEHAHLPLLVVRPKATDLTRQSAQIEPPCPACVQTRKQTQGERWWCKTHGREHVHVHGIGSTQRRDFAKSSADSKAAFAGG